MKPGLDRLILQTKDLTDQGPESPWILYLDEGILIAVETWEVDGGVLVTYHQGKLVHACPVQSGWRLIRRDLVDLVPMRDAIKLGKRDMMGIAGVVGEIPPPDDRQDWK